MLDVKEGLAAEAVNIVSGARRSAYGTPEKNFGRIAERWTLGMRQRAERRLEMIGSAAGDWRDRDFLDAVLRIDPADVATMMRELKEARLIESPGHRDSSPQERRRS